MNIYCVYDRTADRRVAVAAYSPEHAVEQYVEDNPPDLMVELVLGPDNAAEFISTHYFAEADWRTAVGAGSTHSGYDDWLAEQINRMWNGDFDD